MSKLRIIPLGGMGNVTKNMFVYEYEDEMLIVDCGIGFPELNMHGVDLLIPDATYIKDQLTAGKRIVGMVLTHGHDDHIAATGYIVPEIGGDFPIYASPLTAAFAEQRMLDHHLEIGINVLRDRKPVQLGVFTIESVAMTHSVPDTKHYIIRTPEGIIYHGSDFKLDDHPVDGVKPDYERIEEIGKEGILCMMVDCLRIENTVKTKSESTVQQAFEREMADVRGKIVITLMSSHIHRIQQAVNVALQLGRKIVFIGRSVEQNVEDALLLHKLNLSRKDVIDKREIENVADNKLCLIVAGSQGQEGSSLMRAIFGEHPVLRISPHDKVIFSADVIPGNEQPFYGAIDELSKNEIDVTYPDIAPDLHVSGHASAPEQRKLVELAKPQYVFPIGGAYRHRKLFKDLMAEVGYESHQVLMPDNGEVLEFEQGAYSVGEKIFLRELMVDGKGIGDVGTVVLTDRRAMAQDGMLVLVIPRIQGELELGRIEVISRGFVFMRESQEFIEQIKQVVAEIVVDLQKEGVHHEEMNRRIERRLTRRLDKIIGRTPLILPVFLDLD